MELREANERSLAQCPKAGTSFTNAVTRARELTNIQSGDVITLPKGEYNVFTDKVRGTDNTFEYINVEAKRGKATTAVRLTKSLFDRVRIAVDDEGQTVGPIFPTGTAADDCAKYVDFNKYLRANEGRQIKVAYEKAKCRKFGSDTEVETVNMPVLNYV